MKNVMLWISDVLKLEEKIKSVCIMGTIVNILYTPFVSSDVPTTKPTVYEIDDGTGVLRVVHFPQSNKGPKKGPLEIGTTVEVRGVPQFFRDQLEVKAFSVKIVEDPNDEVERMLVVDEFRQTSSFQSLFSAQ